MLKGPIMRIAKWGNSLVVRLPVALVREMNLHDGEEVELSVRKRGQDDSAAAFRTTLQKLREELPLLPVGFKFDREEANAR
jgi:antitoxin MazE